MKKSSQSLGFCIRTRQYAPLCHLAEETRHRKKLTNPPPRPLPRPDDNCRYRYVDLDTVLSKYNLAKDYNEEAFLIIFNPMRLSREKF